MKRKSRKTKKVTSPIHERAKVYNHARFVTKGMKRIMEQMKEKLTDVETSLPYSLDYRLSRIHNELVILDKALKNFYWENK